MKKLTIFLLTAASLTSALIGYILIGQGFFINPKSQTGTLLDKFDEQKPTPQAVQEDANNPILLSDRQVVSPTVTFDKRGLLYFEKGTGKVFEYDFDDKKESIISDALLPNFISARWSPVKNLTLNSYISDNGVTLGTFSPSTGERMDLGKEVRSATFSNDGGLLAYYYFYNNPATDNDPSAVNLGQILLSELDNSYQKKILDTRITNIELEWSLLDKITLKANSSDLFILTKEGKLTKILSDKLDLAYKLSPSGNKVLFSSFELINNKSTPMLWLKDLDSGVEEPLNISGDASKCAWSIDDTTVYCAISRSPVADDISTINTLTKKNTVIYGTSLNISELHLSGLEEYLILLSQRDNKLYSIKIPE